MMTLYGMASPNVVKVLLMLEEIEADYRIERCDVILGGGRDPAFRALNPNGKVPVLIDEPKGAEEPVTVFESGAILLYLAETSGRFLPAAGPARYQVVQWLMFQMAGVGPMFGQAIHFRSGPPGSDYARSRFGTEMRRLVEVVEQRLAANAFLAGADYSIADMAVFPWIRTLALFFPEAVRGPATERWRAEIAARPATARALAKADALGAQDAVSFKAATRQDLDRYFGRGDYARA
jgi:GST-like protein